MKRIKAACLYQTIHFQLKDGASTEFSRRQVLQEYEGYKAHLEKSRTHDGICQGYFHREFLFPNNIYPLAGNLVRQIRQ